MQRTLQAADIAGIRALAVHAKDEDARASTQQFEIGDARANTDIELVGENYSNKGPCFALPLRGLRQQVMITREEYATQRPRAIKQIRVFELCCFILLRSQDIDSAGQSPKRVLPE
jgi:hypothetical protein